MNESPRQPTASFSVGSGEYRHELDEVNIINQCKISSKIFRIIMKTMTTMELSSEDSVESIRMSPLIMQLIRIQSADRISRILSVTKSVHSKI